MVSQISLLCALQLVIDKNHQTCNQAAMGAASIRGLVTLCTEKDNLRAVLRPFLSQADLDRPKPSPRTSPLLSSSSASGNPFHRRTAPSMCALALLAIAAAQAPGSPIAATAGEPEHPASADYNRKPEFPLR